MRRRGFTLIELLIVVTIIIIVSAVALPTVMSALSHRQVSEGARIVQAALAGARDAANRDNAPSGIRFLPDPMFNGVGSSGAIDPTKPLAFNRIIPLGTAPSYTEGVFNLWDGVMPTAIANLPYPVAGPAASPPPLYGMTTARVLYEIVGKWIQPVPGTPYVFMANAPTSWFWNIRVGDKVQINNSGPWYAVIGPLAIGPMVVGTGNGNPEMFVNAGSQGASPWSLTIPSPDGQTITVKPEFLLLVDGKDDNANGWIDEGWDGVDNDGNGFVDDIAEWVETETWQGAAALIGQSTTYTIRRRPAPKGNAREVLLPTNVVVDATTVFGTQERTRVPLSAVNPYTGYLDVMVYPGGTVMPTSLYSAPTCVGMSGSFYHLWVAERSDVFAPAANSLNATGPPTLPITKGLAPTLFAGAELKGESRIVTLFARTGHVTTNSDPTFDSVANIAGGTFSPAVPFVPAQQGVSGP